VPWRAYLESIMPDLSLSPTRVQFTISVFGSPWTPLDVRAVAGGQSAVLKLLAGGGFGGTAAVSVDGAPAWISVPATVGDCELFEVALDAAALQVAAYSAVVRLSKGGWGDATATVELIVAAEGQPGGRRASRG
jgi:hypothetical protein